MKNNYDFTLLFIIVGLVGYTTYQDFSINHLWHEKVLFILFSLSAFFILGYGYYRNFSPYAKQEKLRLKLFKEVPDCLKIESSDSIKIGFDIENNTEIYLPDTIRSRHVHILGVTGSGKSESVILNFLKQDISRGLGAIILDAKGDQSFVDYLMSKVPKDRFKIFDLSEEKSLIYDPLSEGSPLEAAQRLFSCLIWSEEYYKAKAYTALQMIFEHHFIKEKRNPTLQDINMYLHVPVKLAEVLGLEIQSKDLEQQSNDLSGLKSQIMGLCTGYMGKILSPDQESILNKDLQVNLSEVFEGKIIYFRLQSLLSPLAAQTVGRLVIQNINYLTGSSHRGNTKNRKITPIYLDEFATFASPEFADLISKARSAGFALHFSHQSNGELIEVSEGFLNRITDNSATKIVLRVNDPDTAEYFSRTFGTSLYEKVTKQITNTTDTGQGDNTGKGTSREAHQFRSSPDHFKTLPTGVGSVLIAHGLKTKTGASHVFTIQFPRLT